VDLEHRANQTPELKRERRSQATHLVTGGVIGAALLAFIVQNTYSVTVSFLMFSFSAPMWLMVVVIIVVSLVLAKALGFVVRRQRTKRGSDSSN
jgi:uncharacterized integral membrane protein